MFEVFLCLLLKILIFVYICHAEEHVTYLGERKVTELFPEIYDAYLQAVLKDENILTRRLFKNSNKYTLHIQKLKEVNGVKTHNIVVKDFLRSGEPLVYINNPVEAHTPNAFLTQEQFKKSIMNNIRQQQREFENEKINRILSRIKIKSIVKRAKKYSESNFNEVSPKSAVADEEVLTRLPTTRSTTDNTRDAFIAMLNGETIPPSTISTTHSTKKKTTIRRIAKGPGPFTEVTTEPHVLVNTIIDAVDDTNTTDKSLSETTIVSKDSEENTSEATTSTNADVTTSETTASTYTDVTSTEATIQISSDIDKTITDINVESSSVTETTETTTPMTSTESTSTESTSTEPTSTEPTSTESTSTESTSTESTSTESTSTESTSTKFIRSTRGRPFVFMGLD